MSKDKEGRATKDVDTLPSVDLSSDQPDAIEKAVNGVQMMRDEIGLRMHLASKDLRDEWEVLEARWAHFQQGTGRVADATRTSGEEISAATRLLLKELVRGYQRIRSAL